MKVLFKIFSRLIFLILLIQGFFWGVKLIFPINKHTNIPQELGYNYINKIVFEKNNSHFYNRILNIGDSSVATAINTRKLGNDVMTLGVWGSSPAELYFYIHKYLATYQSPKCILFTHILSADYYRDHSFWELVVPYSKLSLTEYSEIYDKSKEFNDFPGNSENKLTFMGKILATKWQLFFATPFIYYEKLKYRNKDIDVIRKIEKVFDISRGEYVRLVQGSEAKGDWWNFFSTPMPRSKYYDHYIDLIFKEAADKNIKIYTFTPPFSAKLTKLYPQRLMQLISYYQEKSKQYDNVIHIDLRSYYPKDNYIDDAHLNFYGATKFTNELAPYLDCQ